MQVKRFGGSFAPPLTADTLTKYKAASVDSPGDDEYTQKVKTTCRDLIKMVEVFNETPSSSMPSTPHKSGRGRVTPLEDAEVKRIFDVVPWDHECETYKQLFDRNGADGQPLLKGELRNAAFHLLWFAVELSKDREPLTNDKL